MKLWQKEYKLDRAVEAFTVGEDYLLDQRLVKYDCIASIAHAEMLANMGILSSKERISIVDELNHIIRLWEKRKFFIRKSDEDCHTAIENHLTRTLGETGKKIHTFRSRNDQVTTALRLYYKDALLEIKESMLKTKGAFVFFREQHREIGFPGFNHTRKAMPSTIEMWIGAFIDSMRDNLQLLDSVFYLIDQSPLGSGSGYGFPQNVDRLFTSERMKFQKIQENPLYVQNSRGKFESAILNLLSFIMMDVNKMASDLIFFSLPEFNFMELPNEYLTGSSMMPHIKNPDILEILRANYHRVLSNEFNIKSLVSQLISGYHRDFQLIKGPIFEGLDITSGSLNALQLVFKRLKVNKEACESGLSPELFSTERVYNLVMSGMPFRDAYHSIAREYFPIDSQIKRYNGGNGN